MTRYLLDTDALSEYFSSRPSERFVAKSKSVPAAAMFTTAITQAELLFGARRVPNPAPLLRQIRHALTRFRMVAFESAAAERYGELRAELERKGTPLAAEDLMIASIARAGDFTLVTGNVKHFLRVPALKIEDWIRGKGPSGSSPGKSEGQDA